MNQNPMLNDKKITPAPDTHTHHESIDKLINASISNLPDVNSYYEMAIKLPVCLNEIMSINTYNKHDYDYKQTCIKNIIEPFIGATCNSIYQLIGEHFDSIMDEIRNTDDVNILDIVFQDKQVFLGLLSILQTYIKVFDCNAYPSNPNIDRLNIVKYETIQHRKHIVSKYNTELEQSNILSRDQKIIAVPKLYYMTHQHMYSYMYLNIIHVMYNTVGWHISEIFSSIIQKVETNPHIVERSNKPTNPKLTAIIPGFLYLIEFYINYIDKHYKKTL